MEIVKDDDKHEHRHGIGRHKPALRCGYISGRGIRPRAEHPDLDLAGWSPDIKKKKAAVYKAHKSVEQRIQDVKERCCADHPEIATEPSIRGGLPHIRGSRITVQYILDRLAVYGSIKRLVKLFPHISEAQIKEAIGYARDFMERACGQVEAND